MRGRELQCSSSPLQSHRRVSKALRAILNCLHEKQHPTDLWRRISRSDLRSRKWTSGQHVVSAYFGSLLLVMWNREVKAVQFRDENCRLGPKRGRNVCDLLVLIGVALLKHVGK